MNYNETLSQWTPVTSVYNDSAWLNLDNISMDSAPEPPAGITRPDMRMEDLQYAVRHLQIYLAPCVSCVGVVSNVLCVIIMIYQPLLSYSTTHYILAILVCDALQLLFVIHTWLNEFGVHMFFLGGWCQFVTFANDIVTFTSSWCLAALGLDRFICVRYPYLEPTWCLTWVARIIIISIAIIATVVYLNISLLFDVMYIGDHAICHTIQIYMATIKHLGYADLFVNAFVPCSLITVFAIGTLCQLIYNRYLENNSHILRTTHTRQRRQSIYSTRPPITEDESMDLQQDRVVLALLFTFLVLTLPYQAYRISDAIKSIVRVPTHIDGLRYYLVSQILVHAKYVQLALDTVVIVLGHSTLRQRFVDKFVCKRCVRQSDADHEMTYTHRLSYEQMSSNDDSTVQIIRHEIQGCSATAV